MPSHSIPRRAAGRELVWLAIMNGASVSTLYWAQALLFRAAAEFGQASVVRLMPGATLAGYAVGVALLASAVRDLTSTAGLVLHLMVLTTGLCAAASASDPISATIACLIIGIGCSLTQRLLACATSAVPPEARSETIGWIIGSGLLGIVLARACVPFASAFLGWRAMFWLDAVAVTAIGLVAVSMRDRVVQTVPTLGMARLPSAMELWHREKILRGASLQQGLVFAAFNLGWALYPRLLQADGVEPMIPMGIVASLGAGAAILSGRICSRWAASRVAWIGLHAAMSAIALLGGLVWFFPGHGAGADVLLMACLDVGTQIALVANQGRAQALATSPAMRGRITAMVTTVGFGSGALGAAVGNLIF